MKLLRLLALAAAVALNAVPAGAAPGIPAYLTAAIADTSRPAEDVARDANRKPGEVLAFAGVKPGGKVVDFIPGGGYFTRIFSKVVGPKGRVYALQPAELDKLAPQALPGLKALAAQPAYSNVTVLDQPLAAFGIPEPVDLVWTSQNYHDLHDSFMGPADMARLNKAIFDALKPGGIYLVLDHAAAAGTGLSHTEDLHRIDPASVKAEVTAAGFKFVGESTVLRNPDDPHTAKVFDPSIRGKTDQFIFKFRKPMTKP